MNTTAKHKVVIETHVVQVATAMKEFLAASGAPR
jgi:hypothetical protein